MIFSVFEFFQKTNERILLTTMKTCFRSFFGRNQRHQKSFRNYLTFNLQLFLFYPFFQVVVLILTLQCAFGLPDPGKAGKQCTLVRSPTDTGKDLWIRGLLLSIHVGFYGQFWSKYSWVSYKWDALVIIFKLSLYYICIFKICFHPAHKFLCFKQKSPSFLIKN